MLKQEFQYYLDHQVELVKQQNNKVLVIKDEAVVGVYETKKEAYDDATTKYEFGTFLIQHCSAGYLGHTQTFHSRVVFGKSVL